MDTTVETEAAMNEPNEDEIYRTDELEEKKFSFPVTCMMIVGIIALLAGLIAYLRR